MRFNQRESIEVGLEAGLEDVLRNFRSSVQAWSEAEFVRPRTVLLPEHRRAWRRAAAWALGCVLAAGSLSAGLYEHHAHQQWAHLLAQHIAAQHASLAASQEAARPTLPAPAPAAGADEKLMAAVDQSVSQEVPSAMEPLAQLMDEDANQ